MTELKFTIAFHGPFAVSSGYPDDGLDHTIDRDDPLPATQLRGLLRAHAEHWLGIPQNLVNEIFGHAGQRSPWIFTKPEIAQIDCENRDGVDPGVWNRVQLEADGRSKDQAMVVGQQTWATSGTFEIVWHDRGQPPPQHLLVLRAAARDIVSVGLNRRRGMGTVTITDNEDWSEQDTQELIKLRETT